MPDYDFRSLSDYDFEILARDLLQKELGIRLESYAKGRDGGIDFRYVDSSGDVIVQCKHYAAFVQLHHAIKTIEARKVKRLKPKRYILAVSTPITPANKEKLLSHLSPYCQGPSDIFGREDLNNLLGRFPSIEETNFKLWLSSEPVLARVLQSGIWGDAELTLDRIRRRTSIYVQNPSYGRAKEILDKYHHCIIAGLPGIGKTTLAEILLVDYVDRHAYQAVRIANDLSEIKSVKRPREKQIFYFDDFLGTAALDKIQKNEDKRLLEFMEEVERNENWRFILTTREYILNTARMKYESLANAGDDLVACTIELADYTVAIRAKILYNHIYFSGLPPEYKLALLKKKRYLKVISHRNYNPRIVEHMTKAVVATDFDPENYYTQFIANLDNPSRIWDHAFRQQLSEASQHLLLAMSTLPDPVLLSDLKGAFEQFYAFRRQKLGIPGRSRDFDSALKELDGNFIKINIAMNDHLVDFHNPSVRDFLDLYLLEDVDVVGDLIEGACFWGQLQRLWSGRRNKQFRGVIQYQSKFIQKIAELIDSPVVDFITIDSQDKNPRIIREMESLEERVGFVIEIADKLKNKQIVSLARELLVVSKQRLFSLDADRRDFFRLLVKVQGSRFSYREQDVSLMGSMVFSEELNDVYDFAVLGDFVANYPGAIPNEKLEMLRSDFGVFCETFDSAAVSDPDELRRRATQFDEISVKLDVDVEEAADRLRAIADALEEGAPDSKPDDDWEPDWEPDVPKEESVDEMFDRLRDEIEQLPCGAS